jgi:predicted dehydrogenase
MPDLKAAVIGTGGAARLHLEAYRRYPHTQPVAVCSNDRPRAEAVAVQYGVRVYTSIDEMLERERPDVVSVATLEWDHEAPVLQSLAAGAHVLCEKIMAHTLAVGEGMVAAAARANRQLGVNYNYRSVPAHCLIRAELAHQTFGPPALFTALTHAYLWPHMLDLIRYFFGDPVEVSGTLVDDQALRPPVSVASGRAWKFAADSEMLYHPSIAASATLRFRNPDGSHFLATLSSSAFVPLEENFWSFMFYGRSGAVGIHRATRANLNGLPSLGALGRRIAALPPYSYPESFDDSVAAFAEAIRQGLPVPITGADGLAALRLDAAITQAMQTGRTVTSGPSAQPS